MPYAFPCYPSIDLKGKHDGNCMIFTPTYNGFLFAHASRLYTTTAFIQVDHVCTQFLKKSTTLTHLINDMLSEFFQYSKQFLMVYYS